MSPNHKLALLMDQCIEAERVLIEANNEATTLWYAMVEAEGRLERARETFNALQAMVEALKGD